MKVYLFNVLVDGFNIANYGFNWKNRLLFTDSRRPDQNIANAYVKVPYGIRENFDKQNENWGEALRIVTLFSSCYQLVTDRHMPHIAENSGGGFEIEENDISIDKINSWTVADFQSKRPKVPINDTMDSLHLTTPFFDKVMNILENQGGKHRLDVALIMYYKSASSSAIFDVSNFINLITALEALYSDGTMELRHKISMRAALFTELDISKRRQLFEDLKKMYDARSKLVHGSDISLSPINEYTMYEIAVRKVVRKSLLNYIELASTGKSKKQIIDYIDDIALGSAL